MRGGAQAHLLECDDGHFYVVKFQNNPQHRRVLVNEWIASVFLRYLQIPGPDTAIVNLPADFLAANPDVCMQFGKSRVPPEAGWHFGSAFPGDPARIAVYDFLPDVLLEQVVNLKDFLGMLAFDKWVGNADARQSIFFRARLKQFAPAHAREPQQKGFVAYMIDHGYVFNGPHWTYVDSPLQGLYFRPMVYQRVSSFNDFQPWLDQVVHFPEEVVDDACKQLPPQWIAGDEAALEALLTKLMQRRKRVPELIRESGGKRLNPFPNWK